VRVENLDFEWWSRNTALILLGRFFLGRLGRGVLCWVIVVFVVGFWGKTSVEVCGGCGRCKRN
jgi:hypothetical protein